MKLLNGFVIVVFWVCVAIIAITLWPYQNGEFSTYEFIAPKPLTGNLALNERLNGAKKMFENRVHAPEALTVYNDELYTGLENGEIVKITRDHQMVTVFKTSLYDKKTKTQKTGRPLALKFDKKGYLYATDIAFGIFKIDLKTKKAELLVDIRDKIEGASPLIANSLDIASNGDIYWSDTAAGLEMDGSFLPMVLMNPSGRLIRYSQKTKENEVLLRNVGMANGVILAKDESFVLLTESTLSRIQKYHLKGSKAGQHEILTEGLPGLVDNIYHGNEDDFLLSVPVYHATEPFYNKLVPHPYARRFLTRLSFVLRMPFEFLHKIYPAYDPAPVVSFINAFGNSFLDSDVAAVFRLDKNGKVTDAAYFTNGIIPGLSSAHVFGNDLWLGSFKAKLMAKLPLKTAFPTLA